MFGLIRTALWTVICVGAGVFLASYPISGYPFGGKTPLEYLKGSASELPEVKLDKMKDKLAALPKEHITETDRNALNNLIAKKGK